MSVRQPAAAWLAWFSRRAPPGMELQAQLFVLSWVISGALLLLTGAFYALGGLWGQTSIQLGTALAGLVMLVLFARTGRLALCQHVSLAIGTVTFAAGTLAQTPPDLSSLAWLGVAPLCASLVLPGRVVLAWLVAEVLVATLVLQLAAGGYHLDQRDAAPELTATINFALMFTVMAVVGMQYRKRVELQVRAEAANRAKEAFLATISHEIRTPMNGILGMTELLEESEQDPARKEQLLTILRSGELLSQLVSDMLDFTKVESGKVSLENEDVDLVVLVRDLERLFTPLAAERGLHLRTNMAASITRVSVDVLRLRQVLSNLLGNALKFTKVGTVRLDLETDAVGPDGRVPVTFAVTDTGSGIAAETLPRLFLPFEQGDSATNRRFGGIGLGLAIAQKLVTLLGGELRVDTALGRGSSFSFTVRLAPASLTVPATPPAGVALAAANARYPVLVVDDNPINLKVATALVQRAGFAVVTATNGEEALLAVNDHRFAAVLMDCHMPEVDGFECARRMLSLGGVMARTPIIAVSASAAPDDVAACREAGMCDFVAKPISYVALLKVLDRHVGMGSDPGRAPPSGGGASRGAAGLSDR